MEPLDNGDASQINPIDETVIEPSGPSDYKEEVIK
jgi:hypothetical protein